MGSLSSEKALPISLWQMNSSKRSVRRGSLGLRLASGDTSTGYMVMKVGWISFSSTFWSKHSYRALPQVLSRRLRQLHAHGLGGSHGLLVVGDGHKVDARSTP